MRHLLARFVVGGIAVALLPVAAARPVSAANFPPGLTDTVVSGGLGAPTSVVALPDGRMLVSSQQGKLWAVATNGSASVAIDLAGKVCSDSEEGLLGVAIDPQFATNRRIYVFYTAHVGSCSLTGAGGGGAKNRVSRFTMSGATVDPGTEVVLLDNMPEWGGNHNGGDVRVGPDGNLYVSVGDGGGGSPASNPSDLSLPNGKILRVRLDGSVPPGNPHGTVSCRTAWGPPGSARVCGEIWADGLRNPFRLGVDASSSSVRFRINDVGDRTWEEVNDAAAGAHYGWPCREGPSAHPGSGCRTPTTNPVLYYNHSTGCVVETGGAFVPAGAWPGFEGSYLWVDFACGRLFLARPGATGTPGAAFATGLGQTTDLEFFRVAGVWSLFYTTYANGGELHRVAGSPPTPERAPWERLGGTLVGGPAASTWAVGRLDVFARGTDDQLWHRWFDGRWSPVEPLGGTLSAPPAAVSWAPGRIDTFTRGADGQLWHKWFDGRWSRWERLGGALVGAPAVASWAPGRLDVFVRGTNGRLLHKWFDGRWSAWESLGGTLTASPAATSWGRGRLDVFVRGTDGRLRHAWFGGRWSGFEPLGGTLAGAPAATSWAPGRLDVFVRRTDGHLWHTWFDGRWSAFEPLGGDLGGDPAAASWGRGRLDVFVRGADGALWHKWFDGRWF